MVYKYRLGFGLVEQQKKKEWNWKSSSAMVSGT
jgi:hypothetical protein